MSLVLTILLAVSWFGWNLVEGDLPYELRTPAEWVAPVVMLLASLAIYLLTHSARLSIPAMINAGLAYQVVVSFCIPFSHYWRAFAGVPGERLTGDLVGLSPVVVWMLGFTVLVPARPRNALVALILSGASVPVTMALLIRVGDAPAIPPMSFFSIFVLPYAFSVGICYLSARVLYGLGKDVRRAQEMGSYRLVRCIGRGGMGEVWEARHSLLVRSAAIKLIRRDALGTDERAIEAVLSRFEREAQVTAELQSPHTVELYDFGMSEDGSFYYVMELLSGFDLETLIRRHGPVPAERAIHILRQVCRSLGEAHRKGLVHRDIKPSNIYLCERAFEPDFVKVLDFGLVKRSSPVEGQPDLTELKTLPGTPAFLAPELVRNEGGTIDGRADFYSLGCVAFWLLTGKFVFDEPTVLAMILAHVNAQPPAPSLSSEVTIPRELDRLVLDCLAKRPADRPASAEEIVRKLDGVPLEALWTSDRAAEWWSMHHPVSESSTPASTHAARPR